MKLLKLKDVCSVNSGISPPKDKKIFENGTVPFYKTLDVGRIKIGNISDSELKVSQAFADSKKVFEPGTILFPKSGASTLLNHRVVIQKKGLVASTLAAIVPIKDLCLSKYLYYYLLTIDAKDFIPESFYPGMKISEISEIPIPVPSLQEQEKIVERLDKVFENIQNNLDMLNYLNTLITTKLEKSIFISKCEKVDTKKLKVKEFSDIQGGGTPKTSVKEYWGGEIDFYTPKELSQHSDIEISSSSKKVTKLGLSKGAGKLLPVDTILFSSRAPIGYVAILKKEGSTNQGFQSFILKNQNDKYFFYFLLRNNKEYIESYAPGATFKDISKSRIEEIEFAIPSYEQQIEIGKKMVKVKNNIEKKSKLYKSNYEDLLKLRKSILDKEFSYE